MDEIKKLTERSENVKEFKKSHYVTESWFNFIKKYWSDASLRYILERELQLYTRMKSEKLKILDAGCGFGNFLISLRKWSSKLELYGVDFLSEMLEKGKKRLGVQEDLICGDLALLPFRNEVFDIVFFLSVIEHLNHPKVSLLEAKRVLKTGGTLVITTPNRLDITQVSYMLRGKMHQVTGDPTHRYIFTKRTLYELLTSVNLKKVRIRAEKVWIPFLGRVKIFERLALEVGSLFPINLFQINLIAFAKK